jgi:serine/threonine protein kinase
MADTKLPYRLGKNIGHGGFADVFEAEARDEPGVVVAFKRARPDVQLAPERLAREIDVQRRLDHPNVMPVIRAADDRTWFVMPLAIGNLKGLWESGRLGDDAEALALELIDQVSHGLEHAQEAKLLHRDVSPGNILALEDQGGQRRWVVSDWGAVKRPPGETTHRLTGQGEGMGTAGFAAPETWSDAHEVDQRADVYGLGRVVAWLLTGRWPSPNVPLLPNGRLRGFLREATAEDPDRRIATMADVRSRLDELLSEPPTSPRGQVQALVERAETDGAQVARQAIAIASLHSDQDEIWLDELARLPAEQVGAYARADPEAAAAAAQTMLGHLEPRRWGNRDFTYLNIPLGWAFEVLRVLVEEDQLGLAEDVAVPFFEREAEWDRWKQKATTIGWLRSLSEPQGAAIARAMRQSGVRAYYAAPLANGRIISRSLAAEFGR